MDEARIKYQSRTFILHTHLHLTKVLGWHNLSETRQADQPPLGRPAWHWGEHVPNQGLQAQNHLLEAFVHVDQHIGASEGWEEPETSRPASSMTAGL
jgi:hypothetical protein